MGAGTAELRLAPATGLGQLDPFIPDDAMLTVNIQQAKANLSRLVEQAARGESFVIAEGGKPLVRVRAVEAPAVPRRLGFLAGTFDIPSDFDTMGQAGIERLFDGAA